MLQRNPAIAGPAGIAAGNGRASAPTAVEVSQVAGAAVEAERVRERFIPVSRQALMRALWAADLWPGHDPSQVRTCFRYIAHWRHLSYADRQQELIEAYLPFNPDRDVAAGGASVPETAETAEAKQAFIERVRRMLERANYNEIDRARLQAVIDEENPYGLALDVDLDEFEDILVFVRGTETDTSVPGWYDKLRSKKPVSFLVYQRLFLLLKLKPLEQRVREVAIAENVAEGKAAKVVARARKMLPEDIDDRQIYIKMFKEIPRPDLEMMFPNARIKFRQSDKVSIGASASGGIGMSVLGIATKLLAAALTPFGAVLAVLGFAGATSQQVAQVVHRRSRYMLKVTRSLYFQNLSNNQGALALLTERAEEEDIKEELLLYALLAKTGVLRSELAEAKAAIEQFLAEQFDVDVDFDAEDALGRLIATGLVVEHPDGLLVAMSPATAAKHIDDMWDVYLDHIGEDESRQEHA